MSAGSAAQAGRRAADRLMTDAFAAYAPNGTTTDADGMTVPAFIAKGATFGRLHAGVRLQSVAATTTTVGGVERPVYDGGIRIPVSAPAPAVGWEYQMTAAGPATDPSLVGRRWHVVGVQADSYATARRLNVVEVIA
jgi:hypothetical protein